MARHAAKHPAPLTPNTDSDQAVTTAPSPRPSTATGSDRRLLLVRDLGWSQAEATDTHFRLRQFEDDWAAPEMDAYDDL